MLSYCNIYILLQERIALNQIHPVLPILASMVLVRLEKIESNVSAIKDSRWEGLLDYIHKGYKVGIRDPRWVFGILGRY